MKNSFTPPQVAVSTYNSWRYVIYLYVLITFVMSMNNHISFAQNMVNNGSFEIHTNFLPFSASSPISTDFSAAGNDFPPLLPPRTDFTSFNWINRSLGFCIDPNNLQYPNTNPCTGWYTPNYSSADYYIRAIPNEQRSAPHVTVPNIFNPMGNNNEMRQPFGFESDENQNAYIGLNIWHGGGFNPVYDLTSNYREYVQSQLISTMLQGHYYNVSFRVSLSKTSWANGYLKNLGAYFSEYPTTNLTYYVNNLPTRTLSTGILYNGNDEYNFVIPQLQTNYNLNLKADLNGLYNWMLVSGTVYCESDYNYITIGNFEPTLESFVPETNFVKGDQKRVHYFIDSVVVTETTVTEDCLCGEPAYQFHFKASDNQTDSTLCCYDFTLKVQDDPNNIACPLMNFKIKVIYASDPLSEIVVYDNNNSVSKGTTVTGNFCYEEALAGKYLSTIKIEYYDTPTHVKCSKSILAICRCYCNETKPDYPENNKIYLTKSITINQNDKCCFDLWYDNSYSECHYRTDEFRYFTFSANNGIGNEQWWSGIDFISGLWTANSIKSQYDEVYKWFQRPEGQYIFPNSKILIGTICIPDNNFEYVFSLTSVISDFVEGVGHDICDASEIKLQCKFNPEDCCDDITVEGYEQQPENKSGLIGIILTQIPSTSHPCDIYGIKFFNTGERTSPFWQTPTSSRPIYTGPAVKWIYSMPANVQNGLSFDICFYSQNGSLICCKHLEYQSIFLKPPVLEELEKSIYNELELKNLKIFPTPGTGEFKLGFTLEENKHIRVDVLNNMGEIIQNSFDNLLNKSEKIELSIDLYEQPQANYFIRIIADGKVIVLPVFVLK